MSSSTLTIPLGQDVVPVHVHTDQCVCMYQIVPNSTLIFTVLHVHVYTGLYTIYCISFFMQGSQSLWDSKYKERCLQNKDHRKIVSLSLTACNSAQYVALIFLSGIYLDCLKRCNVLWCFYFITDICRTII